MLTVAEETLQQLADEHGKEVATHLYGQEINPSAPYIFLRPGRRKIAAALRRAHGRDSLFLALKKGRDGYLTHFGKWFQDLNREYVTRNPRRSLYSIRHNVATTLKHAEVPVPMIEEIMGHAHRGSQTEVRYAKRYKIGQIAGAISKIDHGVDWTRVEPVCRATL